MTTLLSLEEYKALVIKETNNWYNELIVNAENEDIPGLQQAKDRTLKAIENEEDEFMESFKNYCMMSAAKDMGLLK